MMATLDRQDTLAEFLAHIEDHFVAEDGMYDYSWSDGPVDDIYQMSFGTIGTGTFSIPDADVYWMLVEYWWRFGEVDHPGIMPFEKVERLAYEHHFLDPFLAIHNGVSVDDVLRDDFTYVLDHYEE